MQSKIRSSLYKYWAIMWLAIVQGLQHYKLLIGLNLFMMASLVIFSHLWQIAATKIGAVTLNPDQLLWYIALNEWVLIAIPDIQKEMEHELHSGRLAYLLPRPISYIWAKFSEGLGTLLLNLAVLGPIAFSFTWYWTGSLPFSPATLAISILLGMLAGVVALIFNLLIGLSSFWVHEVTPFHWLWEKCLFVFGGLILPLTLYPNWIQKIAFWTPFPAILGARSALVLEPNLTNILWITFSLLTWAILGSLCLLLLYRRGQRIIYIGGG